MLLSGEEETYFQILQFCPFSVCQDTVLRTKPGVDRLHGASCLGIGPAQAHRAYQLEEPYTCFTTLLLLS